MPKPLLSGVIVPIDEGDSNKIEYASKPILRVIPYGSSVQFTLTFNVPNGFIVDDQEYDEEDLAGLSHLKFDDNAPGLITSYSITGIYLKQIGDPESDRRVGVDFEFTFDDGKVGGAGANKKKRAAKTKSIKTKPR